MTTRTAAEALDRIRSMLGAQSDADLATLRAALAQPQEGEVEECLRKIDRALQVVFALCKGEERWRMSIPVNVERDSDVILADALSDAARLLRATQAQPLTDAQIVEIRDDHLPSQGEPFDCLAFARAVLRATQSNQPISDASCRPGRYGETPDANTHGETGNCADQSPKLSDGEPIGPANNDASSKSDRKPASHGASLIGESPAQSAPLTPHARDVAALDYKAPAQSAPTPHARDVAMLDFAAPAQEPVATLEAKVSTLLDRALTTGYGSTEAIYALANLAREPLYAAPPQAAPAQEPVDVAASSIRNGSTNKGDKMINYTGRHKDSFDRFFASTQKEKPVGWRKDLNPPHGNFTLQWLEENPWPEQNHVQPLYAAPPPDEARAVLAQMEMIASTGGAAVHCVELLREYLEKHK